MIESILSVLGYELEAMVCGVGDKILIRGVQKIPPAGRSQRTGGKPPVAAGDAPDDIRSATTFAHLTVLVSVEAPSSHKNPGERSNGPSSDLECCPECSGIKILSFSYKAGVPAGDYEALDCRELRNPYGVAPLKDMTVLDPLVKAFVSSDNAAQLLYSRALMEARSGKSVAFGCVGGKHRSVVLAEMLADRLKSEGVAIEPEHIALTGAE